jgi:hypothetical protein
LKKSFIILIVLLPWTVSSWGQPVPPGAAPLLPGENISNAIVLSGSLPITAGGTTAGYLDNYDEVCPYTGSTAPDVVYAYTPPSSVTVDIDLCGSTYDTKVFVYENTYTPGIPFACNDDFYFDGPCGMYVSKIEGAALTGGNTYYIVIDGYDESSYGNYVLTINGFIPPPLCVWGVDIVCPPGAIAESETCGADANGGCNMAPGTETWEPVPAAGGTFCGTTWANGGSRDSDWFELVLTEASAVTLTANSDREILFGMVESTTPGAPTCATTTGSITPGNTAGPCSETSLDMGILSPGTYWFIAEMTVFDGFPCINHYWIEFSVAPVPCAPPAALSASNITPVTAELGWTETGIATAWEYQYGPAGFTPGATGTPTTVNPKPIAGLSANTSYDFYIRANCGGGVYSAWSGPENFKTPCNPVAAIPWSENFDAMAIIGNNILPACWAAESFSGTPWSSGNAASVSYNDPCSAPNYVFVYYSPYPEDKYLITPGFTLTAATSYDFMFNWIGDGYAGWTGDVLVNTSQTGTAATVLGSPFVVAGTTTSASCIPAKRSFVPSVTGTYYFMVRVSNTVIPHYLGFDDFVLILSPLCTAPANLAANSITQTTANLGWTPGGSETAWEYVYGISPLPPPVGSGFSTSSSTFNPISGLSANTEYQFYVRSSCGSGFSTWAGPSDFHTLCDAISSFPWTEGFEAAWPPDCWIDSVTADFGWDQSIFGSAHSGSEWAYCNLASSQFVTPALNLSADSRLVFWYRVEDAAYPQDMAVKIGNNVIYQITGAINETYKEVHLSLSAYTGQTVSISFTGESGTGGVDYGICLDDVSVSLIKVWTGNISTAWNNIGNWNLGVVPDQYDDVFIPSAPLGGRFPEIASGITAECYDITIAASANIKIKTGGTLNVKNP